MAEKINPYLFNGRRNPSQFSLDRHFQLTRKRTTKPDDKLFVAMYIGLSCLVPLMALVEFLVWRWLQ